MTLSEQARADAIADAETLLRYLETEYCRSRLLDGPSARPLNYGRLRNLRARTITGAWEPRQIAHAAFRAVPGLREP